MNKTKIRFNFSITAIVVLIMLLLCSISTFFFSPNKVFALTSTGSAVQVGNGAELYDKTSSSINKLVVNDLQNKLFKDIDNPINYIKNYVDTQTDSYILPSSVINSKLNNNAGNDNGLVITIGGLEWMVTSLTLADYETNKKEDIKLSFISSIFYYFKR